MTYKTMKKIIKKLSTEDYENFIKAIIWLERGVDDMKTLDVVYSNYMENDSVSLINDTFDDMIESAKNNTEM